MDSYTSLKECQLVCVCVCVLSEGCLVFLFNNVLEWHASVHVNRWSMPVLHTRTAVVMCNMCGDRLCIDTVAEEYNCTIHISVNTEPLYHYNWCLLLHSKYSLSRV